MAITGRTVRALVPVALSVLLIATVGSARAGIGSVPAEVPQLAPPSVVASEDGCELEPSAAALMNRILTHPGQQRARLRCNPLLSRFAAMRARDMAERGYFSHVTPGRVGPNALLEEFGYPLPSIYAGQRTNTVEAIAAGLPSAEQVWDELLSSPPHRRHLLAEHEFFENQDEFGIAHYRDPDSEYGDYWVIIIARQARPDEPRYLCTPEPAICFELSGGRR